MNRIAVSWAGVTVAAASFVCSPLFAESAAGSKDAVRTLSQVRWSEDGSVFAGLADEASKSAALQAYDGVSGRPAWRFPLDRLRDPARGKRLMLASWQPSAAQGEILIESDGDLFLASAVSGATVRRLTRTKSVETGATLSPDGFWVAFERDGDLWAIELVNGGEHRLTTDGRPPAVSNGARPVAAGPFDGGAGFAWAPESRTIAFLREENGASRLGTVNLVTLVPQIVDTGVPASGRLEEVRWRFDSRALGVERRSTDGRKLDLLLCQPEKLYCRKLAERPVAPESVPRRDLDFFGDGFVWGSGDGHTPGLARYDTLGRERFALSCGAWRFEALARLDDEHEVVLVSASGPGTAGGVEHALLRLSLKSDSGPLLLAVGGETAHAVAPDGERLVVEFVAPDGERRRELRAIDGKRIAPLPPPPLAN